MRKNLPIFVCALIVLAVVCPAPASDVIDRIVATVNGQIILQSDWDDELAYEAFIAGKPLQQTTPEDRKASLDRLIDHELLRQQIAPNDPQFEINPETLESKLQEVRKQFPGGETDQIWQALLARYNLSADLVKSHVAMQIKILRLIDEHLVPNVQVEQKSIEDYYNQTFLPQVRKAGAKEPSLVEVTPQIRELLTQQKLNDGLKEWLQNLHDSSVIVMKVNSGPEKGLAK